MIKYRITCYTGVGTVLNESFPNQREREGEGEGARGRERGRERDREGQGGTEHMKLSTPRKIKIKADLNTNIRETA